MCNEEVLLETKQSKRDSIKHISLNNRFFINTLIEVYKIKLLENMRFHTLYPMLQYKKVVVSKGFVVFNIDFI